MEAQHHDGNIISTHDKDKLISTPPSQQCHANYFISTPSPHDEVSNHTQNELKHPLCATKVPTTEDTKQEKKMNIVKQTSRPRQIIVEVCQGPNCTGLGSGAAILEIEELIAEDDRHHNSRRRGSIVIKPGGCRDLCSMGPNVRIYSNNMPGGGNVETFDRVDSPQACYGVTNSARSAAAASSIDTGWNRNEQQPYNNNTTLTPSNVKCGVVQSMMTRRAERMRWDSLRRISRVIAMCRREASSCGRMRMDHKKIDSLKKTCAEEVSDKILKTEVMASGDVSMRERAERRTGRLNKIILRLVEEALGGCEDDDFSSDFECDNLSSDEESGMFGLGGGDQDADNN